MSLLGSFGKAWATDSITLFILGAAIFDFYW
jgi:hypothetical protein